MKTLEEKLPTDCVNKIKSKYGSFENIKDLEKVGQNITIEARFFSVLSDPSRLKILKLLKEEELCVCMIAEILRLEQTLISHHLTKLKYLNIINERREGKWIFYSAKKEIKDFFNKCEDIILKLDE